MTRRHFSPRLVPMTVVKGMVPKKSAPNFFINTVNKKIVVKWMLRNVYFVVVKAMYNSLFK